MIEKLKKKNDYYWIENIVGKGFFLWFINPFPNKPWFLHVCSTTLLKTLWEKEKLLATSNFSFSHSVFYLFEELSAAFVQMKIVVCKLFSFWQSPKFVVWEWVKTWDCVEDCYENMITERKIFEVKVDIPSLNHGHNPLDAHWNDIANANVWWSVEHTSRSLNSYIDYGFSVRVCML